MSNIKQKIGFSITAVSLMFLTTACEVKTHLTRTYKSENTTEVIKEISIKNDVGSVEIRAWDHDYILMDVDIKAAFKADADEVKIKITEGEIYTVETKFPDYFSNTSANYTIRIPKSLLINADVTTGSIRIYGGAEAKNIKVTTGSIEVRGTDYIGNLRTTTGSVDAEVNGLNQDLKIKVTTGSIDLTLKTDDYNSVFTKTTTGSIKIDESIQSGNNVNGFNINLETTTGSIRVTK